MNNLCKRSLLCKLISDTGTTSTKDKNSETSDEGHSERGQTSQQRTNCIYTQYKVTSERGQPLYRGQKALLGGSIEDHTEPLDGKLLRICSLYRGCINYVAPAVSGFYLQSR